MKNLSIGIDIATGITSGKSKTGLVILLDDDDTPICAESLRATEKDFDDRLIQIGDFVYEKTMDFWPDEQSVGHVLISAPKKSLMRYEKKNPFTGMMEKKSAVSRSMVDLAQARGAVSFSIGRIATVHNAEETHLKERFTGFGGAKKELVWWVVQQLWRDLPEKEFDIADAYMNATICRNNWKMRNTG